MPVPANPLSAQPPQAIPGQIQSVQALRAIAALFVVAFHATVLWHDKFAPDVTPWRNGNAGVDLFFVISGFIMVVSSRRLLGRPEGWHRFMILRLIRIVPMYWLVTAAKLAAMAAVPVLVLHTNTTAWNAVASFLFLPARDAVGTIRPVLDVGWTLSFEMLFYVVFATALFFLIEPLLVVAPVMAGLAVLSLVRAPDGPAIATLANPMVLEFVVGMVIGRALQGRTMLRLASPWMIVTSAAGIVCLAFVPTEGIWSRATIWGLAAAVTLAAAVLADRWLTPLLPRWLTMIGEASYSLYLTHGFVLPLVGLAVARMGLSGIVLGTVLIAGSLIGSTMTALLVYRQIESPVTERLRKATRDRRRTGPAAPQAAA